MIVNGCETPDLVIDDVFEIEGGHSPLVVEITAPRKPRHYTNLKHRTKMGASGIQAYSHHNCLAGWFARVLVTEELRELLKENESLQKKLNVLTESMAFSQGDTEDQDTRMRHSFEPKPFRASVVPSLC